MNKKLSGARLAACAAAILLPATALSGEVSFETSRSEASRGFGAINHQVLSAGFDVTPAIKAQVRLEHKRQDGSAGTADKSGMFLEGIFSYPLTDKLYGMTRIGATDEITLFIDNSIYQELGYKLGRFGDVHADMNVGIGSRRFPSGTEQFANVGPTLSWASGALWLRREQSLDGGGYRHVVSVAQWVTPAVKVEGGFIKEARKKYTLPVAGISPLSGVDATRVSLGATYRASPSLAFNVRAEKVSLEKEGTPGKYYDPMSFAVGVTVNY